MESAQKLKIELLGDKTVEIGTNETILDASLNAGIPHFHACGGNAECSTCRVLVLKGLENLTPINEKEEALRKIIGFPPQIRLACQTCVTGEPVHVRRIILEDTDLSVYIKDEINDVNHQVGEKKELVLFFLDIRNFTPFVESYLPFDVIHVMRATYIIFNHIIKKNSGIIIDTAGDGFYAVFGMNQTIQEAADSAIIAGNSILKELGRFNETYLGPYFNTQFEIGIGVHAGPVIVGDFMVGQKSHLSVMGLAVNVASRIQACTKKLDNSFIASEDVVKYSTIPPTGRKRMIKLRGINDVYKVYMLGNPYSAPESI
jgi:adenylate cyclase